MAVKEAPPSSAAHADDTPAWEEAPTAHQDASRPAEDVHVPQRQPEKAAQQPDPAFETLQDDDFESLQPPGFDPIDEGQYEHIEMGDPGFDVTEDSLEQAAGLPVPAFATERKKSRSPRLRNMNGQSWPALAASLPVTGLAAELARQSEWIGLQGEQINLRVAIRTLAESPGKARLCTVLSEHFGTVVQLNVEYGATGDETAHAVAQAQKVLRQQEAEQAVAADPFIQTLISEFGARVVPGSISAAPLERAA